MIFERITILDPASNTSATVAPARGALVTSFRVDGHEVLYLDEETFADPAKNVRGGIPVLFPSPGRLHGDRWQHAGHGGAMKQHGFARTKPWQVVSTAPGAVRLKLAADAETLAQFPWQFVATLDVCVAPARLRLDMRIENASAAAMPCALGYHPYFAVDDKAAARLDSDATRAFDNVSRETRAFDGHFDFTAAELDLHLIDQRSRCMTLRQPGGRIEVSASQDFAHWVVWAVAGRNYVCVEPWTAPGNALNSGEHLLTLAPGASHSSRMEIAFER